jgi:hypothetical protein
VTAFLIFVVPLIAAAKDIPAGAWEGNWVANSAKSKFPGPPPKIDQVTIQADGSIAVHVVSADETVKISKVSDYRLDQVWNSKGKLSRSHATLSKDGKTQTFYGAPGKDKNGKPFQEVVVYEKQPS